MTPYGDGSACEGAGKPNCAMWGNDSLPRCTDEQYQALASNDQNEIDPNSRAGQCAASLDSLRQLIEDTKTQDEANYQQALAGWQASKNSAMNSFRNSHTLWRTHCENHPSDCENNIEAFFRTMRGEKGGYDYRSFHGTLLDCQMACLKDARCDWYSYDARGPQDLQGNRRCWLKGRGGGTDSSFVTGLKTDTGMREIPVRVKGCDDRGCFLNRQSKASCFAACWNRPNCDMAEFNPNGDCNMKHAKHNPGGRYGGIKNIRATDALNFGDNNPYIRNTIDPKPTRSDFSSGVNVQSIVCQDCSQAARDITTEDSTDVVFDQLQQCVINTADAERRAKEEEEERARLERERLEQEQAENGGTDGTEGEQSDGTEGEQSDGTEGSDTNTGLIVGLSVGGLMLVIIIVFGVMLARRR
jgi:hypothetical protein